MNKPCPKCGYCAETRTGKQNSAIHLFCTQVAEKLNEAGYGVKRFFEEIKKVEIDWSSGSVKENIWRPLQQTLTEKYSTTEIDRLEVDVIYDQVNRVLSDIHVHVPFPSKETKEQSK